MKKKILFVVSLLFGLLFIHGGMNKFFNYVPVPDDMPQDLVQFMAALMSIKWLIPLIATFEIIGGVLIITNRFRALGAIVLFPILVGILLTHIVNAPSGLPMALVLFAIELWVIYENRAKYLPMIEK